MASRIWAIVGPSGIGKSTLVNYLLDNVSKLGLNIEQAISFTTRPARSKEIHGKDYYFISILDFEKLLLNGQLAEHIQIEANLSVTHYGITKSEIQSRLNRNQDVLVVVEPFGVTQLKSIYPDRVVTVYLDSPYKGAELERLLARGESLACIQARESLDTRIRQFRNKADIVLVAGDFETLAQEFISLIKAEKPR